MSAWPRAALAGLVWVLATPVGAQDRPPGVVLTVGELEPAGALAAAERAGGARWRLEALRASRSTTEAPVSAALDDLQSAYDEGDFPRCLAELADPTLGAGELVGRGMLDEAARVTVLAGACMVAAGEATRGRESFARATLWELPVEEQIGSLRPDIQAVAEQARTEIADRDRIELEIRAPDAERVRVDGRVHTCRPERCVTSIYPGEHVITVEALGRTTRVQHGTFTERTVLPLSMDVASRDDAVAQLRDALSEEVDPESTAFARTAADAYGARVVVIAWQRGGRIRAAIYDRARDRVEARQSAANAGALPLVVRNVIAEWRAELDPGVRWWVWAAVGAAAIVAGIAAYLLVEPAVTDHAFEFQ